MWGEWRELWEFPPLIAILHVHVIDNLLLERLKSYYMKFIAFLHEKSALLAISILMVLSTPNHSNLVEKLGEKARISCFTFFMRFQV